MMTRSRAVLVALFVLGCASPAAAQTPAPSDVLGWQDFRWGMTEADVQKVAAASGLKLVPKDTREGYPGGLYVPFESAISIHDSTYTVRLFFLRDTQKLQRVLLLTKKLDWASRQPFPVPGRMLLGPARDEVHGTLLEKYGKPTEEKLSAGGYPDVTWIFPTTTIRLSALPGMTIAATSPEDRLGSIAINYSSTASAPSKDNKDKL